MSFKNNVSVKHGVCFVRCILLTVFAFSLLSACQYIDRMGPQVAIELEVVNLPVKAPNDLSQQILDRNCFILRERFRSLNIRVQCKTKLPHQLLLQMQASRFNQNQVINTIKDATVNFYHVVNEMKNDHSVPAKNLVLDDGSTIQIYTEPILTGTNVIKATSGIDQTGVPAVYVSLDARGTERIKAFSRDHVSESLAVVFSETGFSDKFNLFSDARVLSSARIMGELGQQFQFAGISSVHEAQRIALYLHSGRLALPVIYKNVYCLKGEDCLKGVR